MQNTFSFKKNMRCIRLILRLFPNNYIIILRTGLSQLPKSKFRCNFEDINHCRWSLNQPWHVLNSSTISNTQTKENPSKNHHKYRFYKTVFYSIIIHFWRFSFPFYAIITFITPLKTSKNFWVIGYTITLMRTI